jgi:CheY-like chemotaxis protein
MAISESSALADLHRLGTYWLVDLSALPFKEGMTFKVLIIEDNHSFIDSLKVMLRDLPLDFVQAFRYADAQMIMEKSGIFHNRSAEAAPTETPMATAEALVESVTAGKKKPLPETPALYNAGGVFTVIVEQNTESSMKGTDFISHVVRKYPALSESDFILLTHRLELVPTKQYAYPVLEKPLRAPQIRQILAQRIKQAQEIVEMQIRLAAQTLEKTDKSPAAAKPKRTGIRDFLNKKPAAKTVEAAAETKKSTKTTKPSKAARPKKSPKTTKKAKATKKK